ncbi:hypothetical protein B0H14DRAFT_2824044 [Mycena olivaceomarginata]|nr:hypothetical protein B0H14DRAFT_2824044 [Mycena olivaceomarginata]
MMVWTFLPPHSLVVFQTGLANLITRIGWTNHGMEVLHKCFSCCRSHELENCYQIHLPLPPASLKIFCPLPTKTGS